MFLREFLNLEEKPGCNMTEEGRSCPEHGMMECPGYKMIETSAKDKLHQRHRAVRKKLGMPNPDYYKELKATFDLPDDERWARTAEIKRKYGVEEELKLGTKLGTRRDRFKSLRKKNEDIAESSFNDYDHWRDAIEQRGGTVHPQKNRNHLVAQSWDGDIIGEYDLGRDQGYIKSSGIEEGLKLHGGIPDVDHMRGSVIRDPELVTHNVKFTNKGDWDRATDKLNAEIFDDMAEFRTDSRGESVTGNSAVWAYWDNATDSGWINVKGRQVKPHRLTEFDLTNLPGGGSPEGDDDRSLKLKLEFKRTIEPWMFWAADQGDEDDYYHDMVGRIVHGYPVLRGWIGNNFQVPAGAHPSVYVNIKSAMAKCHNELLDTFGDIDDSYFKQGVAEEKKGLYYYVNKRKKAGTSRPKGHPKAPSAQDWKDAAKTAKNEGVAEGSETECPRCHSTDIKTYSDGEKECHQCHKTWDVKGVAEAGPFSYGAKKPRKGSVADLADKKRKEQEKGQQPIEPKDQMVGVARVLPKDVSEEAGISRDRENKFHAKLDKLVHNTFGKRKGEMEESLMPGEYYTYKVTFDDGSEETLNFSSDDINWDRVGARRGKQVVNVKRQGGIQGLAHGGSTRDPYADARERQDQERAAFRSYDRRLSETEESIEQIVDRYAGTYTPEAVAYSKRFCKFYNLTDPNDIQFATEMIDLNFRHAQATGTEVDPKEIKKSVADGFRYVMRGLGPSPNFRKKFKDVTNESIEKYVEELKRAGYAVKEEKTRLDPKCWKGKKIGNPKTKMKGGVRVNNCVPK